MNYITSVLDIKDFLLFEYRNQEKKYAIGSITLDKFIIADENNVAPIMYAIKLLDGTNSNDEIRNIIKEKIGSDIDVDKLCDILGRAGLLKDTKLSLIEKTEFETLAVKLLEYKLDGWKGLLLMLSKLVFPFTIILILLFAYTMLVGDIFTSFNSISLLGGFRNNFLFDILTYILIVGFSIFSHELAHGIVGVKYGLLPQKLTLSLYMYFSPIVYIRIPGIYTVAPRKRLAIFSAGILMNIFLFCIGFICYNLYANTGSIYLLTFLERFWYINLMLAMINLFALLPLDGYFIFSTIFKIPNLRKTSFFNIKKILKREKMKIKIKLIYVIYFVMSLSVILVMLSNEFSSMINMFNLGLNKGVINAFWDIKQYIIIIVLVIVVKCKKRKKVNLSE